MPNDGHFNFPTGLDIKPLVSSVEDDVFDEANQKEAIIHYGIAGRVWEAAQLLVDYAESQDDPSLEVDPPCSLTRSSQSPFTIIELGSGTGYVGLLIAKYLYRNGRRDDTVVLTDLPDVCALLEHNLGRAKGEIDFPNAFVAPLSWGNYEEAISLLDRLQNFGGRFPTHILCSDLVYFPHLLAPLLRSLLHVTSLSFERGNSVPEIFISYKVRSLAKESPFWSALGLWFSFSPAYSKLRTRQAKPFTSTEDGRNTLREQPPCWRLFNTPCDSEDLAFVFIARRKAESYGWSVPQDDASLLSGVGAGGLPSSKSDDTFETLLLMLMQLTDEN